MSEHEARRTAIAQGTERLEAFSDGVIAIAITLLVLDLKLGHSSAPGQLAHDLGHQWATYASYLLSFTVIGIMWVNHHTMFSRIALADRTVLYLNLLLLLGISVLPFPTSLMAEYLVAGGSNANVAAAVYSLNLLVVSSVWIGLWSYLSHHGELLAPGFAEPQAAVAVRRSSVGLVFYGPALAVAAVSPIACLALHGAGAVFFAVTSWHARPAA